MNQIFRYMNRIFKVSYILKQANIIMSNTVPILRSYIIYLEHNQSRLSNVEKLIKMIPETRIFPAIDGLTINFVETNCQSLNNSSGSIQDDEKSIQSTYIALGFQLFKHNPHFRAIRGLKLGYNEAACLLSHVFLWYHIARSFTDNEVALILEDDAVCDDPQSFIESIKHLPPFDKWDMCELFTTTPLIKHEQLTSEFFTIEPRTFTRASAYLLTRSGARAIIEQITSLDIPADDQLSALFYSGKIRAIFPEKQYWNHLERTRGWESSMWDDPNAYLHVEWNRPINMNWIGMELGRYTGIGNQMFQWAAAKVQAMKRGVRLVIKSGPHFKLAAFPYIRNWQEWAEKIPDNINPNFRSQIAIPSQEWNKASCWKEQNLSYDETIQSLSEKQNWVLDGYLQHVKYIEPYIPLMRMVFEFDDDVKASCQTFLNNIKSQSSREQVSFVAVHLRLPDSSSEHLDDFCMSFPKHDFVYRSMDLISQRVPNAHFILCSNDPDRCRSLYNFGNRPVSWAVLGLMEDMCVMSMCDHFILSSSTYGYWAAILSRNKEKIIIASKPFFGPRHDNLNAEHDLAFPEWTIYDMNRNIFIEPKTLNNLDKI